MAHMLNAYLKQATGIENRLLPLLEKRKELHILFYNFWYRGSPLPYYPTLAEKFPGIGQAVEHYNKSLTDLWHNKKQDAAIKTVPKFDHRVKRHWEPDLVIRTPYPEHTYENGGPPTMSKFVRRCERIELHEAGMETDFLDVRPTFCNTAAMTSTTRVGTVNILGDWDPAESPALRMSCKPLLTTPFYKPVWRRDMFIVTGRAHPAHTEWGGHTTAAEYVDSARRNLDRRAEIDSKYDWLP